MRKRRSLKEGFAGLDTLLRETFVDRPLAFLASAQQKIKDLPGTNFDLGCRFAASGRWLDAMFRFKLALWLQPNFPQAMYNLGCCYLRMGNYPKAKEAFIKTLRQRPNHAEAAFMLAAIDLSAVPPAMRPTRMIAKVVRDFFARIAPNYDAIMEQNRYAGAALMFENMKPLLAHTNGITLVDMGCGTGLLSRPWRTLVLAITGIDFCPEMLTQARAARVNNAALFDQVLEADILALTPDMLASQSADVVLLGDVAQFLGDLAPVFASVARVLKPGGLVGMTIEPMNAVAGYAVNVETGRFGHHPEYVKKTAQGAGLVLKKEQRVNLYPDYAVPLMVFSAAERSV